MLTKIIRFSFYIAAILILNTASAQENPYHLLKTYHIGGSGHWDYVNLYKPMHHLYVSHGDKVHVLDERTGKVVAEMPAEGVHGFAFAPAYNKGFITNGAADNLYVFDLKTNKVSDSIKTGKDPDAIMLDPYSGKLFVCDGHSSEATVVDPATNKVVATIPLAGKPETAVSDGAGNIYVNIETKSEVSHIDAKTFKVVESWPIGKGESPSGLAIDRKNKRLFIGCDNNLMIIMNAANGKVVSQLPIGEGCDGTAFDPHAMMAFSSNGEGTLTIVKEDGPDRFHVVANLPTKRGARTCTLDPASGRLFLSTAEFEASPAGSHSRPRAKAGSFQVLVVGK